MGPEDGFWFAFIRGDLTVVEIVTRDDEVCEVWFLGNDVQDSLEGFRQSGGRLVRRIDVPEDIGP